MGPDEGSITFCYEKRRITLKFHGIQIFDILSLVDKFAQIDMKYNSLIVEGKDLLDIGGNIGDTAIFYSLKAARRIISLEPNPVYYKLAIENIKTNKFENITILNEGAGMPSYLKVAEKPLDRIGLPQLESISETHEPFREIRIRNLDQLVEEYVLHGAVLKVICVGCEQDLFKFSSDKAIMEFDQILIVCVTNWKLLKYRLKKLNFRVMILSHDYVRNPFLQLSNVELVSLLATKADHSL
jgi:FkbM family methyltransferase